MNIFSFGFTGYDSFKFCSKAFPNFIDKYPNGRNPSKTCIYYQYYTCHIKHYCTQFTDLTERKKCEEDAVQFWTPLWDNAHGDLEKRVSITRKVCDIEQQRNSLQNK